MMMMMIGLVFFDLIWVRLGVQVGVGAWARGRGDAADCYTIYIYYMLYICLLLFVLHFCVDRRRAVDAVASVGLVS